MNHRYWLFRRNGIYYLEDAQTGHKESLRTSDRREAQRLREVRDDAAQNPNLGIALAKAYLSNRDPQITKRTWQDALDEFCSRGQPQTQARRRRVAASKPFDAIRSRKILETIAQDFLSVLQAGGVMVSTYLRCVQNLALGLGWLLWPVLPSKLWPPVRTKPKRGITAAEYQRIMAVEKDSERRQYYQLLWEIGASQSDAARLRAENIDWSNLLLSFQRQKTSEWSYLKIGPRLEALLRKLPAQGALFPRLAQSTAGRRAAEFRRRCRLLKLNGISLHSFRYGFAERASESGFPERYAQAALGHGSRSVHRCYAKRAKVIVPSLELFEHGNSKPLDLGNPEIEHCGRKSQQEST